MTTLPTRSQTTIVSTFAAGVQGRAAALVDFSVGSVLLAIGQAIGGVALWLQAMVLQVLLAARLATSSGSDVDTFVGDFELTRLPAAYASGQLTFTRLTPSASTPLIPVGATVQTPDGSVVVKVVADPTNGAFNVAANGYYIASEQSSVSVTAQAATPGTAANVAAGLLTVPTTTVQGVDTVINAAAFTGGTAAETDSALKSRFSAYILGLSKGDAYGVASAIRNMNVGVAYTLTDQYSYSGAFQSGYYYVVADDGSGYPSSTFLAAVTTALQAVKPLGVMFGVFGPRIVSANVSLILTTLPGYVHATVVAQVVAAITAGIQGLGLGVGLDVYQIAGWAIAVPGVAPGGVAGLTLNSLSGDAATIAPNGQVRILPGTITAS